MPLLYKYLSSERICDCLPEQGNGTLRATQPSALNDPFECSVRGPLLTEYDNKVSNNLSAINPASPVSERDIARAREKYGSLYVRELLTRQLSARFGIISFSTDLRLPLMWSHYTTDGSGFAVGYDMDQLRNLDCGAILKPVEYFPRPPSLLLSEEIDETILIPFLCLKSCDWSYEKEWRLIVDVSETMGTEGRDRRGFQVNVIRIPDTAVKRVYCTERTPPYLVERIQSRLEDSRNLYGAERVTKLVLSDDKYGYEEEEG